MVTEQIKSVLSALCSVFYSTHMVSSLSFDVLILQLNGKESIGVAIGLQFPENFILIFLWIIATLGT